MFWNCPSPLAANLPKRYEPPKGQGSPTYLRIRVCPECAGPVIHASGCLSCPECGWARCG